MRYGIFKVKYFDSFIEIEVGAVVTRLCAVKQRVSQPVIELELFEKVLHFGVCELCDGVVGVNRRTAVVIRKRLEAKGCTRRCERCNKEAGNTLEDVEGRLGKSSHCGGVRQMQPLIADKELGVGLYNIVLIRGQGLVVLFT